MLILVHLQSKDASSNDFHSGDLPSKLMFENLQFVNWTGSGDNKTVVDIECSPAVGCHDITFENFHVQAAGGEKPQFICQNTFGVRGLDNCTPTGQN
jgi:galacturan 1,4-alpha-galacturonidase